MINNYKRLKNVLNHDKRRGTVGNGWERSETVRDYEGLWCHDGVTMMDYG